MKAARVLIAALALSFAAAPLCAQGLYEEVQPTRVPRAWTVDDSGGADFTNLPAAISGVRAGDLLLVAPGNYTAFVLRKGLTIVGDGGVPRIYGASRVVGVDAGQSVCLRGLEFDLDFSQPALHLEDNDGSIWIESCTIHREISGGGTAALKITDSSSVVVVRASVVSSVLPLFPGSATGPGLGVTRSAVHAYESEFHGGNVFQGAHAGAPAVTGGNGVTLVDSSLDAAGSTFLGGQGESASFNAFLGCTGGAPGGAGLDASLAGSAPILLDSTLQGGPGGDMVPLCPLGGPPGPASSGTIEIEPLPLRSYEIASPVAGGTSYQISASGQPGEFVWSIFSEDLLPFYVPNYFGTQVSPLPVTLVFEGVADGSGILQKSVPVPPLAHLTSFERRFAQGLFFDALNNAYLGSPSVLIIAP